LDSFDIWIDSVNEEVLWLKKEHPVFIDEFKNSGPLLKDINFELPL